MFVMPTLVVDDDVSARDTYANFDDLQITTFTETFSPRNYFNSFPPECQVVKDAPIFSPVVHANFLRSRYKLSDTSITLCSHVPAAEFGMLVVLANKWKGKKERRGEERRGEERRGEERRGEERRGEEKRGEERRGEG